MSEVKLCVDCVHCKKHLNYWCERPDKNNYVDGICDRKCSVERLRSKFIPVPNSIDKYTLEDNCGLEGKYFEAKEVEK